MITGVAVSGLVVAAASVVAGVPRAGSPEATAIEVPAGSEFDQSRDDTQAELPAAQEVPDAADVAKIAAPQPDDLSTIDTEATTSAAQPEAGDSEVAMLVPEAGDSGAGIAVETDSPVLPSPQANAPEVPVLEEELSISTEPAQPALPEVSDQETAFVEEEPAAAPEEEPDAAPADDMAATDDTAADSAAPETEATTENAPEVSEPEVAVAEPADEGAAETMEETGTAMAEDAGQDVMPEETPALPEEVETPELPEQDIAALAEPDGASGTIDDIAANVTTDRLPSVTAAPEPVEEIAPEEEAEIAAAPEADASLPPIRRFAAQFENPEGKPMMSIILIDDGQSPIGLDALKSFPYPLSFAVDSGWSGAEAATRKYRDAGFEVLAMIDLPEGASASDTEVSVQTYLGRVPEAVAIMEGEGSGLRSSRDASEQIADILRDSGHGAVLFPNGLNTAQKLIAREGVPSASVFRDFDAKGQSATVIRRFLDQAAFRAGQEDSGVIMVGRLRADTISALLLWGLQDRASRVAIAPVSAVLLAE